MLHTMIANWLSQQGVEQSYLAMFTLLAGLTICLLLAAISFYLVRYPVLGLINKLIVHSKNTWDDLLLEHNFLTHIALLVPMIMVLLAAPYLLPEHSIVTYVLVTFSKILLCIQAANSISVGLNFFRSIYCQRAKERYLPLNAAIQVIKLAVYLVAVILALSLLLDRSPIYLLSGLGALTAVLLLVFQDTIKGLVASIQISANRMLAPGDWVELPQYGADGDVIEIGLNTVKIHNFDKTVTTVPTYALISGSFKNWHAMYKSGGRRIKRALLIDINSVHFYQVEQLAKLNNIRLLAPYLADKQEMIQHANAQQQVAADQINAKKLTNIGTFRAYIEAYLRQHDKVNQDLTCMVRQLPATASGLPLELYFFSNDQDWVNYEAIQSDIFDHLIAMAPYFELRLFQHAVAHQQV